MKKYLLLAIGVLLWGINTVSATTNGSTAYGWTPLSSGEREFSSKLVKFKTSDPTNVSEEFEIDRFIRAAVCIDGTYYMIAADDGLVCYSLLKMDISTKNISTITDYSMSDRASALMVMDMTYDASTQNIYALAFDITAAEEGEDGEIDIPFGLFTIDKATGEATLVGYQNNEMLYTLAASPEGQLVALSSGGTLWNLSKSSGELAEEIGSTEQQPTALQSMTFDKDGLLWWAGFNEIQTNGLTSPNGFLANFTFYEEEYFYGYNFVGKLGNNLEVVGLYIDPQNIANGAPSAVTSFSAIPGETGATTCLLQWKNPSQTFGGSTLPDGFKVNIYRNDNLIKTFTNCTNNETMTYQDSGMEAGTYVYKAVVSNSEGEGPAAYTDSHFVGADIPGTVNEAKAEKSGNGYEINVSWTKPAVGANGGWFDSENLTYKVIRYPDAVTLHENLNNTSFTDKMITKLHGYYYKITAVTSAGEGIATNTNAVVSGPAIDTLPYDGDFSSTDGLNLWTTTDNDKDGFTFAHQIYGNGTHAWRYFPSQILNPGTKTDDWIASVPIRLTAGKHYAIDYKINGQGEIFPINYAVTIGKSTEPSSQTVILEEYSNTAVQGVTEKSLIFSVQETGDYYIAFHVCNAVMFELHGFSVLEKSLVDLMAVSVSGTETPQIGSESIYSVVVRNNGVETANNFKVALIDKEGKELASAIQTEPLEALQKSVCQIVWTPQNAISTDLSAKVSIENDANPENDQTEPIHVLVLGSGSWIDITDGKSISPSYPFNVRKTHGTAQTIYTRQEIGGKAGSISAIKYYPSVFGTNEVKEFHSKIYMANTEKTTFDGIEPIALSEFKLVFEGELKVDNGDKELPIMLDTEFDYTGGNICIMTVSETQAPSYFLSWYGKKGEGRQLAYSDDMTAFDFSQALKNDAYLPNISLHSSVSSGVESVKTEKGMVIYPNPAHTTITIESAEPLGTISIYAVSGALVMQTESFCDQNVAKVDVSQLTNGYYIVKIAQETRMIIKQ